MIERVKTKHPIPLQFDEPAPAKRTGQLLATAIRTTGQFLDPQHMGQIIKPRELVDIIELTPLSRGEMVLYNQLLGNAWNTITTNTVHKVLKSSLRGSHDSNDRLEEAFDTLMGAWAKIRARDPDTGEMATFRVHLLGTNKTEDRKDGYFYYTFPPDLLVVIAQSNAWATLKSHIMYTLRSKYSIRLYEMIERRIGLFKQAEELSIDDMRSMLGVPNGKLQRYADFNKYCLKPAMDEVNQLCDFTVDVMPVKKGRHVEKLFMTWCKKSSKALQRAYDEREKSRVGRRARRTGKTDMITFDFPEHDAQ
jgi:plasmid replication initiation protein